MPPPTLTGYNLERDGFAIGPQFLTAPEQQGLLSLLGPITGAGRRGLLSKPEISAFARSPKVLNLIRAHLPDEPFPVRAIYFDKSPQTNWAVPWHQDLTIAVRERIETPGFESWSIKEGIVHVQPPVELLQKMLTLRIHLDAADESNGALKVLPGSHQRGRLSAQEISALNQSTSVLCQAQPGDALLMRPLLLHSSSRAKNNAQHRRILHLEYACFPLPNQLQWSDQA
ncbi:MAG: phytanoyl-CoA dioxygenase family protein [Limisphaerales bacterium]